MSTVEAFKTFARSKMQCVYELPVETSFVEVAALPTQFVPAWMCYHELGRLQQGESVLIDAGAGGTGQAAIQLSKLIGADIFVTVGSMKKKQLLLDEFGLREDHILYSRDTTFADELKRMTGRRGVDVVVDSLAGEGLFASWGCVAPYGRFVEIGKRDILADSDFPMHKFNESITFSSFDRSKWMLDRPNMAQRGIKTIIDMYAQGVIRTARPLHVYGILNQSRHLEHSPTAKAVERRFWRSSQKPRWFR